MMEMMNKQCGMYCEDEARQFVVENYNWAKPFSNFFPGIGGKWGIPVWVYYVNRAQCISSMGVRDKDHAILEFYSFNKALQLIGQQGFRTFLKIGGGLYEPFRKHRNRKIEQKMVVSSEELEISDHNTELGLETSVRYFPLVNEPIGALIRELRVKNLRPRSIKLELIDGLPRVLPSGVNQSHVKFIARHIEGMMGVEELGGAPIFRLKQTPADIAQVGKISGGNFYASFLDGGRIPSEYFIVDPGVVFGEPETYEYPWSFEAKSLRELLTSKQIRENRTPCAFTALTLNLPAGGEIVLHSVIGYAPDEKKLRAFLKTAGEKGFFHRKREENREIIDRIKDHVLTVSSHPEFDQYCRQTFLDNVLRGGMPLILEGAGRKNIFYLYSRMHGDLERDYHYFILEPTYLSQGTHFYRDLAQNRRNDVWFFPELEDFNLVLFFNLLQTDGYNPQVIRGLTYTAEDIAGLAKWLRNVVKNGKLAEELLKTVKRPFTPGEFIMKLEEGERRRPGEYERILAELLRFCRQNDVGDLHEGFWIDHWTYTLDLIESFLSIYPEKLEEILVGRKLFFYDNPDVVLPRDMKHVLVDGRIRQYGAVARDEEKLKLIQRRSEYPARVRTGHGHDSVYETSLLVKLLCLVANKIATLDPRGIGMEMEADKPGWNDSANGLPGLFGSSLCETFELERLCRFLRESLEQLEEAHVRIFEELHDFIVGLDRAIGKRLESKDKKRRLNYWEASNQLKERYRERTKMGISGLEREMTVTEVKLFLNKCLKLLGEILEYGKGEIFHENGVPYTYFINEVTEHEPIWADRNGKVQRRSSSGYPLVKVKKFNSRPVALFLEGPVHALRVHPEWREGLYRAVKCSRIYDGKLKMYKSCEPLENESFEIGRILAYAPGWIENESVYIHMEYKWLLEVLRSGLYREFYRDIKTALIPFLNPKVYGRSISEGVSFIVSSAFPDEKLHGRGFQPRLSGATAEMLHIWTLMVAGERPFFLDGKKRLSLRLRPILPGWLFTRSEKICRYYDENGGERECKIPENAFAFKFLGRILVVYHNQKRKDTFGRKGVKIVSYRLKYRDGGEKAVPGETLGAPLALDVRMGRVERIDVILS